MQTVSIRLKKSQDKELEEYAKKNQVDKSTAARIIISRGLKQLKCEEAVENVRERRWTIWKAANYCEESYRSFLRLLREKNVTFPLSVDEMELEFNENRSE